MGLETLLVGSLIASTVGTGIGVYSAIDQAQTAKEAAKYNAEAASAEALNRETLAAESSRRLRAENRRRMATLRNNLAGTGVLSSEGTPLAIIGENAANLELGVQDAARAAAMQAQSLRAQGAMSLWEGDQQARGALIGGGASLLGGLGSIGSTYASGVRTGAMPDTFGLYRTRKSTT